MRPFIALGLFFAAVAWVACLGGDFPLNDDWSYGETTRVFLATGRLYMPAACAAGFAHILWGSLFAKLFGFSYVVLRFSSVLAGAIGAVFVYLTLLEIGLTKRAGMYCTLLYATNPILLNLYLGFMSDVPALGLSAAFFYFFLVGIKRQTGLLNKYLIAALLCLVTAVSIRQSTVILALAAPAICLAKNMSWPRRLTWAALFVALPVATFLAADHWLMMRETTGQSIVDHYSAARVGHSAYIKGFFTQPFEQLVKSIAALGVVLCYMGLFTSPLLLANLLSIFKKIGLAARAKVKAKPALKPVAIAVIALSLLICVLSAYYELKVQHALMPFCENILRITSVGAQGIMGIANPILTPRQKMRLTVVSYVLAFLVLTQLFGLLAVVLQHCRQELRHRDQTKFKSGLAAIWRYVSAPAFVVLAATAASLGFLTVETIVRCTDRYYLIALLPVILSLAYFGSRRRLSPTTPSGLILLVLYMGYSLGAGQDYMASNAARWRALNKLESQGIKSTGIDGGAEYNVVRDINVYASHFRGKPPRDTWRWWPIRGEDYIVSFSPIPEYNEKWHESYFSLLTMSDHPVYVLENGAVKTPILNK